MENQNKPDKIFPDNFHNKTHELPNCQINSIQIPVQEEVKYLGLYLDQKETSQKRIKKNRQHLNLKDSRTQVYPKTNLDV
jgi:hypothetical protein